ALLRKLGAQRPADAAARARHDAHPIAQSEVHGADHAWRGRRVGDGLTIRGMASHTAYLQFETGERREFVRITDDVQRAVDVAGGLLLRVRRAPPQAAGHQGAWGVTCAVQNAHRRALTGMSLRHSGHARTVSSTGGSVRSRAMSTLTGLMTKKNSTAAMITKL